MIGDDVISTDFLFIFYLFIYLFIYLFFLGGRGLVSVRKSCGQNNPQG